MTLIEIGQKLGLLPRKLEAPAPRGVIVPGIPGEPQIIVVQGIDTDLAAAQEADWLDRLVLDLMVSAEIPDWLKNGQDPPFDLRSRIPRPSDNGEGLSL